MDSTFHGMATLLDERRRLWKLAHEARNESERRQEIYQRLRRKIVEIHATIAALDLDRAKSLAQWPDAP